MRALIFTEGGSHIGLGHISRCSSLYDELEKREIDVEFIINGDLEQFEIIKDKQYKVINWLSKNFLKSYIKPDDYCIVDSYLAGEELYQVISYLAKQSLFIDDIARIKYPKGIVVNPSLSTKAVNYLNKDTNCYLLGPKYIILRSPFIQVKREYINPKIKEVLITLGGSDIHNLTPNILKQLKNNNSDIIFNVVIGNTFENIGKIKSVSTKNIQLYENATAEEMKSIMLRSDFAITAAGQTIYELITTQTPFIPIKVIENQHNNILALKELDLVEITLEYNDPFFNEKLIFEVENIMRLSNRTNLIEKCSKVIDGLGSKRIIDALIPGEFMKDNFYLRKAKDEDVFDVFQLSNEDYVRKYSINTAKIEWENHKVWFENILKSNSHVFYVVTDNTDEFLGQLRYKIENDSATISISLCKLITGKGLSKVLVKKSMELICEESTGLKNIIAYVSNDNIASRKLFENTGFILQESNNRMLKYNYSIN
ncbi:UDP-2,4-diacetamido-2,4,6-trideoxy-beta-L-altropyranose hydrolase [Rossellomorea vietnamensis]|uniref:UDP-2,4-diacetamido-2,4, 6-trideoxy-beta-L-altropyranose hydrolase n=1 Tax=Rossellomorea vietnamensis TaxID=218284 RepID=A0ACD4C773_9BACI|nr:UDP-2,4-diacetamido-2,4,6-trideoxy-beta-L-altropyranose hydrolase [Rossellomorea vietnamensis]UXH43437.1 UDP-2,4-diacetamido-2,4,6-trideoxy-beta-L-altropyranose hydrolase [Rossellomorea vietnamensis]